MRHNNNPQTPTKDATAEKVIDLLLAKLKAGVNPWRKPWDAKGNPTADHRFFAVNLFTGKPYTGINAQTLEAGLYAGFSQITANGGKVAKGAKAYPVAWFGRFEKDLEEAKQREVWDIFDVNEAKPYVGKYGPCYRFAPNFYETFNVYLDENCDLKKVTKVCKVMKFENVFRIEDTTGLERFVEAFEKAHGGSEAPKAFDADENGDLWIDAYCIGANLGGFYYDGGSKSYYQPGDDTIHVSKRPNYNTPADFYSTAFHEMTHSSGAASRLNRDGIVKFDRFGSDRYAKEELIAEMGACMAMGFLGIETEGTLDNSAAYLGNWLRQKVGEKASKQALETLMAASSSAKFAFAYIAEFYEAAKAQREEENKQKKTEEPLPLPMLPAVVSQPEAVRAYKAEPVEALHFTTRKLETPRGTFRVVSETREELEAMGFGLWFEHTFDGGNIVYSIMHHYPTHTAVACDSLLERIQTHRKNVFAFFPEVENSFRPDYAVPMPKYMVEKLQPSGTDAIRSIYRIDLKDGSWLDVEIGFVECDLRYKNCLMHTWKANGYIKEELPNFWNVQIYHTSKDPDGFERCVERFNPQHKDGKIDFDWILPASMLNRERILHEVERRARIYEAGVCCRAMPNGEAVGVSPAEKPMTEFWVLVDNETAIFIREGTGDNLDAEDIAEGYVDYIYYDTFDVCDGRDFARRAEDGDTSDGGMILLTREYQEHTTLEIARKTVAFIYGDDEKPDWKISQDAPTVEEPDPEHYNDGMIDIRNIQDFCMMVLTNCDGDAKSVGYDDNFYSPADLIEAYESLWRTDWNMDDEKALYVKKLKDWMILTGCDPEELEGND